MTPGALRVVSYNLLHGIDLTARGAVDLSGAAEVLADVDADVIALQEVDRGQDRSGGADQVAQLASLLGMTGAFCPALHGSPDRSWVPADARRDGPAYGVGLLVRSGLLKTRHVRLPGGGAGSRGPNASLRNPGWDNEPRVALVADVHTAGWRLTVIVTHLSYLPLRAVRQLRVATQAAASATTRVLIGDLNLPAWAVRAAVPGWRHAGGQPTFPAWRPRLQMHPVLLDGPVATEQAVAHPRSTSDHRPLVVDLRPRD